MATVVGFPPVTYSTMFPACFHLVTANGKAKAVELTIKQNEGSQSEKKDVKKGWRYITQRTFGHKIRLSGSSHTGVQSLEKRHSVRNIDLEDLTLLQVLAVKALELSAPASDVLLRNRRKNWIQLSGHEGTIAPAGPGTIWKKVNSDDGEMEAYKKLVTDVTSDVVPKFYREVEYNGEKFIEIQDLLCQFSNPAVMDIKMGTRTFLENEVQNNKARTDLYEKMINIDPEAPTPEERESGTITKLRYMQFRETLSSSSTLGFRIEGFKTQHKTQTKDMKLVKTRSDVKTVMELFFIGHEIVCGQLLKRLKYIRNKFEHSPFFQRHEVIGSSILLVHDGQKAGAWIIDFAKTKPLSEGVMIDHVKSWSVGNHEDGYLFGLDNLISILEDCLKTES
ncbi:inositol-trisphosphate 3-kinase homolog isoform X2 [Tachypleus tridentatus]|uniref:inositol-trisphosphate 3-kinase homolog isoform X2 n=1 Tax=Tachypleus tridentatus TaxID=6853 RepID=UPI003FD52593